MRVLPISVCAALVAGCAAEPYGVARIGTSAEHRPGSLSPVTAAARPVGGLTCERSRRAHAHVHVELFGRGQVVIVPPGIGIAPPRERDGAYVRGGRCRYPMWTTEPTGVVAVDRPGLRLGDLFRVWGRPLSRDRLAGFRGAVTVHVDGRRWTGEPADVPLARHAQIVLQAGGPRVEPHATYRFPEGL